MIYPITSQDRHRQRIERGQSCDKPHNGGAAQSNVIPFRNGRDDAPDMYESARPRFLSAARLKGKSLGVSRAAHVVSLTVAALSHAMNLPREGSAQPCPRGTRK